MTLILTAITKKGLCVCADKRYKIIASDGSVKLEDTHNKIYRFQNIPYLIINHGINRINGKDWRDYCSGYEKSGSWKNKGHFQIVNDFKGFIEDDVNSELDRYKDNDKHAIGFLLGGRPPSENKYKVNELHWLLDSNEVKFSILKHQFFVITGDSKVCLDAYLKNHPELLTDTYWKGYKLNQARDELVRLFNLAVSEKKYLQHDDFSDSYDLEFVEN